MKKTTLACYIGSAMVCFCMGMSSAQATSSLDLTIETKITAGTCNAVINDGTKNTTDIDFQSVYIPEVISKSKTKTFDLVISGCAATSQADLTLQPAQGSTCDNAGNGEAFGNASVDVAKAEAVAVEVWGSATAGSGTQMKCKSKTVLPITMVNNAATIPLSARLVTETNKASTAIRAGDFSSQAVFDITYK